MYIKRYICVFSIFFVLFIAFFLSLWGRLEENNDCIFTDKDFTAVIYKIEYKNDKTILYVKDISIADCNGLVLYLDEKAYNSNNLRIGSEIRAHGKYYPFDETVNKGQFDIKRYYSIRGIDGRIINTKIIAVSDSYNYISDFLFRIKERTKSVFRMYFSEDNSGILSALVLGDKTELDSDIKEQYQNAGISHILALSGLHIATIGLLLFELLRKIRIPMIFSAGISIVIMLLYSIMTGLSTSTIRAFIMFVLGIIASFLGRTYDIQTGAAIAAVLILLENPYYVFDSGFLLSFGAVMGIGLVYPAVRQMLNLFIGKDRIRILKRTDKFYVKILMKLYEMLVFSCSLNLTILPLVMYFFYQIPTYGIFINLLVVPMAVFVLTFGIGVAVAGNIYCAFGIYCFHMVANAAAKIEAFLLGIYDLLSLGSGKLKGGLIVCGKPGIVQVAAFYIIIYAITFLVQYLVKEEHREKWKYKNSQRKISFSYRFDIYDKEDILENITKHYKHLSVILTGVLMIVTGVLFVRISPEYEITSLSVGQGSCYVIHGKRTPVIVYDCGSTDEKQIGKYKFIPFLKSLGIDRIDYLFVSHMDDDHVNGILEILENDNYGIKLDKIIVSGDKYNQNHENCCRLIELAKADSIPVYKMQKGDVIYSSYVSIKCLWPELKDASDDINDCSLVLSIICKSNKNNSPYSALFTGDISSDIEKKLDVQNVDYLQVAHHGSKTSASDVFLEKVAPKISVVSAGLNNQYGHPHKETVKLLEAIPDNHLYITYNTGEVDATFFFGNRLIVKNYN